MMMSRFMLLAAVSVLVLAPGAAPALACVSQAEATRRCQAGEVVCARDAVRTVRNAYSVAEVLDVCLTDGGAPVYRVRVLLTSGERREVLVDARSGALR